MLSKVTICIMFYHYVFTSLEALEVHRKVFSDRTQDKASCHVEILELRLTQLTTYSLAGPLAIAALAVILSAALRH